MVLSLHACRPGNGYHAYKTDETKEYEDLLYFSGFFVINDLCATMETGKAVLRWLKKMGKTRKRMS